MYVFVSYSHVDRDSAQRLAAGLESLGIEHFLYEKDVPWGGRIPDSVRRGLRLATDFVILVSPSSLASGWVNFELGIAEGLNLTGGTGLRILPWLVYPVPQLPSYLADRNYKTRGFFKRLDTQQSAAVGCIYGFQIKNRIKSCEKVYSLEEILGHFASAIDDYRSTRPADIVPKDYCFNRSDLSASAIRFVGAADESFPPSTVHLRIDHRSYMMPDEFLRTKSDVVERLRRQAAERGAPFHDGPHTRLIDYEISDVDPTTEQKHLTLVVGPIGWFDYSVARWHTDMMTVKQLVVYFINFDIGENPPL